MKPSDPTPSEAAPCPCKGGAAGGPTPPNRREFMLYFGVALNVVAGILFSIPVLGYLLAGFQRKQTDYWIDLGGIDTFPSGQTRLASFKNPVNLTRPWDGKTDDIPCWVRHIEGDQFQVFAINCTHLGCPVRWFQQSKLFMCPCHGGVFYENGEHASGPPPRGLYNYPYKVENGKLLVNGGQLPSLSNSVNGVST